MAAVQRRAPRAVDEESPAVPTRLSSKRAKKARRPAPEAQGPPFSVVLVFAALAFAYLGRLLYVHHYVPAALPLSRATANDLHGIHDLLTAGASGVFLLEGDRFVVEDAASRLAKLLPQLHPVAECRAAIKAAMATPLAEDALGGAPPEVAAAARASWACLPARFDASSFDRSTAFEASRVGNTTAEKLARRPKVSDRTALGACGPTTWDRACSFWVSLHALSARADARGLQDAFIDAVVKLLAGGATQCAACTNHFRLLAKPPFGKNAHPPLFAEVAHDLAYCANIQCSRATQHVVPLMDCVRNEQRDCQSDALAAEKVDILAFRDWLKRRKHVSAFDTFVVLHNLVTDSVLTGDVKRFECAEAAYDMLPAGLVDVPRPRPTPASPLPKGVAVPGVGPHRILDCPP